MNTSKLYKTQIPLLEWLEKANFSKIKKFRLEDHEKRITLGKLSQIIDLPYNKPAELSIEDIVGSTKKFEDYKKIHGEEICALRLIPLINTLPKLQIRGLFLKEIKKWIKNQKIDPKKYRSDVVMHSETAKWSTIFIINNNGIFGEIQLGDHYQLTQGYSDQAPITFYFDFTNWQISQKFNWTKKCLEQVLKKIIVTDKIKQKEIEQKLKGKFSHNYLNGYFEATQTNEFGLWFVDWNKIVGDIYGDYKIDTTETKATNDVLTGQVGFSGQAKGKVKIINDPKLTTIAPDEILVCQMTTPEYVPIMKTCAGIITEQGGILSHAAIIARELKKPCIMRVKDVLKKLKDGDLVEIKDGIIKKLDN